MAIPLRTPGEIEAIGRACRVAMALLNRLVDEATAGVSGVDLDGIARTLITEAGAEAVLPLEVDRFGNAFTGVISVCVNGDAANAAPHGDALCVGDVVTLDLALRYRGWCADVARSVCVGGASVLVDAARAVTGTMIEKIRPGVRWGVVVEAGRDVACAMGLDLCAEPCGHGIGRRLHDGGVFGYGSGGLVDDVVLVEGMVFTVEPVVVARGVKLLGPGDGFVWRTDDGSSALFEERVVAVRAEGGVGGGLVLD
jgi:methionyl aminopeptidase